MLISVLTVFSLTGNFFFFKVHTVYLNQPFFPFKKEKKRKEHPPPKKKKKEDLESPFNQTFFFFFGMLHLGSTNTEMGMTQVIFEKL